MYELIDKVGIDFTSLYPKLYERPINEVKFHGYIANNLNITENGLAYIKFSSEILKEYNVDTATPSNMINDFNNIKDVYTWIFNKNNYSRDVKIIYNEDEIVVNNTSNNVNTLDKIGEVIINTVTLGTVDSGKISKGNGGIIIFGVVLVLVVGGILIFRKIVNKRNSI